MNTSGTFTSTGQQYTRNFTKQSGETGVRGRLATGPIGHSLAMVATGYWDVVASAFGTAPFTLANAVTGAVSTAAPERKNNPKSTDRLARSACPAPS